MNHMEHNPYQAPSSNLETNNSDSSITQFKRFSAWGVFGLTIITLGIYPIYWLYSRASVINTIHEDKISGGLLVSLVLITIMSFFTGFVEDKPEFALANLIVTVLYLVITLTVLFKIRNRLQVIMSDSHKSIYNLNPFLTFFLTTIYLQYKINERIDELAANQ